MKKTILITIILLNLCLISFGRGFKIGVIKYRGGDWYSAKSAVINFLVNIKRLAGLPVDENYYVVNLDTDEVFDFPFLFLNGHGEILLDSKEKRQLRRHLINGGFLLVNDDYGLDKHFRELAKELFPDNELVKLPKTHPLMKIYYSFNAVPKIHKHDEKPPALYGIYYEKRLVVLYIYETDIADGWEPYEVHKDPQDKRMEALKFGINIVYYFLTH